MSLRLREIKMWVATDLDGDQITIAEAKFENGYEDTAVVIHDADGYVDFDRLLRALEKVRSEATKIKSKEPK